MHNDRLNKVQGLMHKYNKVDKFLQDQNHNEKELIKNLEQQEAQQRNKNKKNVEEEKKQEGKGT